MNNSMILWVILYFITLMMKVINIQGIAGLSQQSTFDYNLRNSLDGYSYDDINWIDIDNLIQIN